MDRVGHVISATSSVGPHLVLKLCWAVTLLIVGRNGHNHASLTIALKPSIRFLRKLDICTILAIPTHHPSSAGATPPRVVVHRRGRFRQAAD